MTKQQFIKRFGENPIDVLGCDWKNDYADMLESADKLINSLREK